MGRGLLLLTCGMVIIFGITAKSINKRQGTLNNRSTDYFVKEHSENVAGSMFEIVVAKLNNDFTWSGSGGYSLDLLGGQGTASVENTGFFYSSVTLTVTGTYEGHTTHIQAVLSRSPFSIYSYFTNIEPTIYFVTGDVLNGPVHSNGTFNIDGNPIFNGRVSSPDTPIQKWGSNPQFNNGTDFNADPIPLPTSVPDLASQAASGGLKFDKPIDVVFNGDGTADISQFEGTDRQCVSYKWNGSCRRYENVPVYSSQTYTLSNYNGIISSSEDVKLKGTLNGQITVHSEKDVIVTGDMVYQNQNFDDPDSGPISDDLMGIVSEGDVIVDKDAHQDHGSQDLEIDASIMALGSSFEVENYNDGRVRGKLKILGGLIQNERGAVGLVSGSGYKKNYTYDNRLLTSSTNGFPRQKRFQLSSYREY